AIEKYIKEKPDLIFLDIIMDKKNGIEVLEEIREEDTETRVVMLTIIGQREILSRVLALGVSEYIVKPFNEERILSVVKKILE
ncbi:MAG: two-component system response regulator, partial [Candidatus Aenigmarchaeota archaeon CG01_land_8_20_14_3_00_37_9]